MVNTRNACLVGDELLKKGHIPFVPHLTFSWHLVSPKSWDEWLRIDAAIIPRCDALLRIPGASKGADIEVKLAERLNIPVYYSLDEIRKEVYETVRV